MSANRITVGQIRESLHRLGNEKIAQHSTQFFKSGKGDYGEGDRFLGVRVPVIRKEVARFREAQLRTVLALLKSSWHEERLLAVLLLVDQYKRGDEDNKSAICAAYLEHRRYINNWDIVDSSAHLIVGPHIQHGSRAILRQLAESEVVWDRRIAMMATYHFIRQSDFKDALKIARILRDDTHDLIHKIVGWMLREIGNRDRATEEKYLSRNYKRMPRTMLRYAIEKFPETRRKAYLNGNI